MSFQDDIKRAHEARPEPKIVEVVVGDNIYQVEVTRLPGHEWAGIISEVPANTMIGYDTNAAGMLACKRYGRLLNAEGEPVAMDVIRDKQGEITHDPWDDLFGAISGVELAGIGATWWQMNDSDPNMRVVELKKSLKGGGKTN